MYLIASVSESSTITVREDMSANGGRDEEVRRDVTTHRLLHLRSPGGCRAHVGLSA